LSDSGIDPTGPEARTLASAFDPRRNSLNFIRLCLATVVILSHSIAFRRGVEFWNSKSDLGTMAVFGFFGISGYLIAGSALRNHVGRYLWQRFLRIFPAFWICLFVTAFLFAYLGWLHSRPHYSDMCGLHCYTSEPNGPWSYVINNFFLKMRQLTIPFTIPKSGLHSWNGSLWSLFFEFVCYLLLAGLAVIGLLRRRAAVAVLAGVFWLIDLVVTSVPSLNAEFNVFVRDDWMLIIALVPIFLVGASIFLYQDRIPDSGWIAWGCVALFFVGFVLPLGNSFPGFALTSVNITAPFLVYPLLWLGAHLPCQRIGAKNDYSYGVYIYAFPVQQILAIWGVSKWGYWPYTLVTIAAVAPFAVASWWLVERNALRLKKLRLKKRGAESGPDAGAGSIEVPSDSIALQSSGDA
jgi:peptidoglycan/LPS O-acetylase OafA/YrhL